MQRSVFGVLGLGSLLLIPRLAWATAGAHAPAVSTFDTRASSIVFAARSGLGSTPWRAFSYNANFASTSGNFAAQFGLHYLQVGQDGKFLHGASLGGAGVFNIPLSKRFNNGVPLGALNIYAGAVPTAAASGPSNFISLPLTIGVGGTFSPTSWLSFTPWIEAAPSLSLETQIKQPDLNQLIPVQNDAVQIDPSKLTAADLDKLQGQKLFTEDTVKDVIRDAVKTQITVRVPVRVGLMAALRLGESVSLNVDGGVIGQGSVFQRTIGYVGGGLVIHWDDIVPAVLPPERRLQNEDCVAVEARHKVCRAEKIKAQKAKAKASGTSEASTAPKTAVPATIAKPLPITPAVSPTPALPSTPPGGSVPPASTLPVEATPPGAAPVLPPDPGAPPVTPAPVVPPAAATPPESLPSRSDPYAPPAARFNN
jgi:hypothetical protein